MSEAVQEATVPTPADLVQGDPVELGDGGKKALEAERKRANALEKQLKQFQTAAQQAEADKLSDLEKAQNAAREAAAQLAEFQKTAVRQKVALEKGVPANLVDRLRGDDEDSLAADADELLALLNKPTTPRPDPSQGAKPALPLNGDALENALRSKLGIR